MAEYAADSLSALALLVNFRKYEGANPLAMQFTSYPQQAVIAVRKRRDGRLDGRPACLSHAGQANVCMCVCVCVCVCVRRAASVR